MVSSYATTEKMETWKTHRWSKHSYARMPILTSLLLTSFKDRCLLNGSNSSRKKLKSRLMTATSFTHTFSKKIGSERHSLALWFWLLFGSLMSRLHSIKHWGKSSMRSWSGRYLLHHSQKSRLKSRQTNSMSRLQLILICKISFWSITASKRSRRTKENSRSRTSHHAETLSFT